MICSGLVVADELVVDIERQQRLEVDESWAIECQPLVEELQLEMVVVEASKVAAAQHMASMDVVGAETEIEQRHWQDVVVAAVE